jgi:hypothetical protein
MSINQYLVRIKNTSGGKIVDFAGRGRRIDKPGGLERLSYHKVLRLPGEFSITLNADDDRIQHLDLDNTGTLDSVVEFWRRDTVNNSIYQAWLDGLPSYLKETSMPGWYKDFEGFLRAMKFQQSEDGQESFTASGIGFNCLLANEPVLYFAETPYTFKAGPIESVMKEFVDENIGPAAVSPPRLRSGTIQGLSIQTNEATGDVWQGARAHQNLLDVCLELAGYGGGKGQGDFAIIGIGPASFMLMWAIGQWGDDKTLKNGSIAPVLFSSRRRNATSFSYSYNRINETNTIDMLGTGRAGDRVYISVTSGTESDSPVNTRAAVRENTTEWNVSRLIDEGQKTLADQKIKREVQFEAIQQISTRYGVHWSVGDLVTVEHRGREFDQKITGVTISVDSSGVEMIKPETEDL